MKKILSLLLLLSGLSLSPALAQKEGLRKETVSRVVPSGVNQRVLFSHHLNPDCSATEGHFNVRVVKPPEHGTVQTVSTMAFPYYEKDNIRAKCNQHKVKGIMVNYKSEAKYVGDDAVDLLVLFPTGHAWEMHIDISVR